MTNCIADNAVKLPVVVDGAVNNFIDVFFDDLLSQHIYLDLKAKRSEKMLCVANATVGAHATQATAIAVTAPLHSFSPKKLPLAPPTPASPFSTTLPTTPPISMPPAAPTDFDLSNLDAVDAQIVQENVKPFTRHTCTTASDLRSRLRAKTFTALCQRPKESFAIFLLPSGQGSSPMTPRAEHPRKRSRKASKTSA